MCEIRTKFQFENLKRRDHFKLGG